MFDVVLNIFQKISGLKIAICFHENGDPDAIGSSIALSEILRKKYNCKIQILFESINKVSSKIIDYLGLNMENYVDFEGDFDYLFLVDTNNLIQLGDVLYKPDKLNKKSVIIIDHHPPHKDINEFSYYHFIDPSYSSTCEILYRIGEEIGFNFSRTVKFLLLAGMIYDSRHFILANKQTFKMAYTLLDDEISYKEIINLLNQSKDKSEKIARLKTAKRAEFYEIDDKWILAISYVSSFEASASRALVDLGADIAVVIGTERDKLRISARSTNQFYDATSFHLGKDLMENIGPIIKGKGGGHSTAAGCNGTGSVEDVVKKIFKIITGHISQNIKKLKT
ncbi:MAG: DHH family phosphoesterase [Candidatus Odinarchaeia archaeon]